MRLVASQTRFRSGQNVVDAKFTGKASGSLSTGVLLGSG